MNTFAGMKPHTLLGVGCKEFAVKVGNCGCTVLSRCLSSHISLCLSVESVQASRVQGAGGASCRVSTVTVGKCGIRNYGHQYCHTFLSDGKCGSVGGFGNFGRGFEGDARHIGNQSQCSSERIWHM